MAVNKDPFVYSTRKNGTPHTFLGLVQAGSTEAIKIGEICTWNETSGYFVAVDAVADHRYPLAVAREEQKAAVGRTGELNAERYIEFYSLHPEDVFEFELVTAAGVAVGDPYTLTASTTQKLTAAAGAFAVAYVVGDDHYPQELNTTIRNVSHANFSFNPAASFWGYRFGKSMVARGGGRKMIAISSAETLAENDMYNTLILLSGTTVLSLPAVKPGMDIIVINIDGATQSVNPDDDDKFRLDGVLIANGESIGQTTVGNWCQILTESADGFIVLCQLDEWTEESP